MVDIEIHDALPNTAILARCQTAYRFHGKATIHALIVLAKHKQKPPFSVPFYILMLVQLKLITFNLPERNFKITRYN
ncbi:conserved hypothetical protein [Vibrio jasicida]|uniref:Uncharacterized protein n=1 Tax=Vibrio jasicida TaxID=766224 RepID=A0AAU9QMD0_9VIBR|nr:conserved hypothetical protein [Vibrio jasicida]